MAEIGTIGAIVRRNRPLPWPEDAIPCSRSTLLLLNYYPILIFLLIAGVVAWCMVGGSRLAAPQRPYPEKLSAYECGFEAFDDARRRFDVRFYLVAILFIIFDLEVAFCSRGR